MKEQDGLRLCSDACWEEDQPVLELCSQRKQDRRTSARPAPSTLSYCSGQLQRTWAPKGDWLDWASPNRELQKHRRGEPDNSKAIKVLALHLAIVGWIPGTQCVKESSIPNNL